MIPKKLNQYASKLMIAIRYKQMKVNALLIPVTSAFLLFVITTDIENISAIISNNDKIVDITIAGPPYPIS